MSRREKEDKGNEGDTRMIEMILKSQLEMRSITQTNEAIMNSEIVYEAIHEGDRIVGKMSKANTSFNSSLSTTQVTIDNLIKKLDDAIGEDSKELAESIKKLKEEQSGLESVMKKMKEIDSYVEMASDIQKKAAGTYTEYEDLEECLQLLENIVSFLEFTADKKDFYCFKGLIADIEAKKVEVSVSCFEIIIGVIDSVCESRPIDDVITGSYVDEKKTTQLKRAAQILKTPFKKLGLEYNFVNEFSERRAAYLSQLVSELPIPILGTAEDIVKFTVGYTKGDNAFIRTMKCVLTLYSKERYFQREVLGDT